MMQDDDDDRVPIQLDIWGLKVTTKPKPDDHRDPASWREVGRRLNLSLMSAVAGIGKLLADVVKSADSIVRGLGDLGRLPSAIEQRIIEAHDQADAAEANHVKRSALSPDDARRVIRQILGKKVAEGLTVAVKQDGHNIFIGILPPMASEELEAIAERAVREARQIEIVQGDTVKTRGEESEQDNSIAEVAGESARVQIPVQAPVQAPDTIMIDGVEVESRDLEHYLAHHPPRP